MSEGTSLPSLLELCYRLQDAQMQFELGSTDDDDVMVTIDSPRDQWTIEVHADGRVAMQVTQPAV